jgi:hypothetical protein
MVQLTQLLLKNSTNYDGLLLGQKQSLSSVSLEYLISDALRLLSRCYSEVVI